MSSDAFQPAFKAFLNTTAKSQFEVEAWPSDLLVTTDFANVVDTSWTSWESYIETVDSFMRPVRWILSYTGKSCNENKTRWVIISPFEANHLLPAIRKSAHVTLHLYSPRLGSKFPLSKIFPRHNNLFCDACSYRNSWLMSYL